MINVTYIEVSNTDPEHLSFSMVQRPLRPKADDAVYVRPLYFGLNAGMRSRIGRVRDGEGAIHCGDVPTSDAIVELLDESQQKQYYFVQWCPWGEIVPVAKDALLALPTQDPIPFLTILGHTGFTAWISMQLANVCSKDHVLVSGAAGGVGTAVVQWAKVAGAKVTGIASGIRCQVLASQYQIDCVDRNLKMRLPHHTVYHDGVGGKCLEAAIDAIADHGRIMLCGNLSGKPPENLSRCIHKNISLQGFTVVSYMGERERFWRKGLEHLYAGHISSDYHLSKGWEQMGDAFLQMGYGCDIGRSIVKVS